MDLFFKFLINPPPIVEAISYPCATPLLYSQNKFPNKLLLYTDMKHWTLHIR